MTALPLALARGAGAVEREHQLGVDVGGAMLSVEDASTPFIGPAFGIHYGYGITDQFNLLVEAQYGLVAFGPPGATEPPTHPAQIWNADVGLTYILDVLRWVPYFGALAGGYLMSGHSLLSPLVLPGAEIVVGLDYLVTPRWAVGFEASEHFLFTDISLYTSYATALLRTEFRWGK
jgi:hypothetical protein